MPRRVADGLHGFTGEPPLPVWWIDEPPPGAPLGALIPLDDLLPQRLAAALRLWRALIGRPAPVAGISRQRRRRLILGLRALDGRAAGASHRELARVLFGAANVPDGPAWKTHDLRSRTLRLVADAIALRDGGYRALLLTGPRVRL